MKPSPPRGPARLPRARPTSRPGTICTRGEGASARGPCKPLGSWMGLPLPPWPPHPRAHRWPYCVSAPPTPATPRAGLCQVTLGPHEGPRGRCPGSCGKRRACDPGQDSPAHHCGLGTAAPMRGPASAWVTGHLAPSVPQAGGIADSFFLLGLTCLSPGLSRLPRRPPNPQGCYSARAWSARQGGRVTAWPHDPHDTTRVTGFPARGGQTLVTPPPPLSCPHLASALF